MTKPAAGLGRQNRIRSQKPGDIAFDMAVGVLCVLIFLVILYPLYFTLIASFSDAREVLNGKVVFLPKGISYAGYAKVLTDPRILTGYGNTLAYSVGGTLLNLAVTLPAAYALSRREFTARRFLNVFFVFTMFFNGGMIATYIVIRDLGLINNPLVFILPFCLNVYNLIVTRTFFENAIPEEMREASLIDGCGHFRYFVSCVLPLSKAVIAVIALYYFVAHWNDFFTGLMYARHEAMLPLQNILRNMLMTAKSASTGSTSFFQISLQEQIKYAAIIISTLPLLIVYPFLQKYFDKGVMVGSLKG